MAKKFEDKNGNLIKCLKCNRDLAEVSLERKGIKMQGLRCPKCGEVYFPSSEIARYEALTGRETTRKFREIGNSLVITVPIQIVRQFNIRDNDMGVFEVEKDSIKVRPIHTH